MKLPPIQFSEPKQVKSGYKEVFIRTWPIPTAHVLNEGFWNFWKANKTKMMGRGFSVRQINGKWHLVDEKDKLTQFEDIKEKPPIDMTSALNPQPLKFPDGLRPWQGPAAARLAESLRIHGAAMDGSETGTGKTYSALGAARELGMKVAVVCPKAVIESWKRTIVNHFGLEYEFVLNYEALKSKKNSHIIAKERLNPKSSLLTYVWKIPKNTLIIFDESQRLKGITTQNTKIAMAAKKQGYKILMCSATNAINPVELHTTGYILGLHNGGRKFYDFLKEYGCTRGEYDWQFNGSSYLLKKLHKEIFLDRGVRLRKEEIPNFPDSEIIVDPLTMDEKDTKMINRLYSEMNDKIEELERKSQGRPLSDLTIRLRFRQKIELLKVPLLVELTQDLIEDGNSVVILCNFSETIRALSEKLNTTCIIWGENKGPERQDNIDAFQADEQRIILVNSAAGGVGVSLHDINGNFPRVSLISPNDSAPLLKQTLGRVWRDGSKSKSQQRIIYIANTVEEQVCNNVRKKLRNMEMINDGELSPVTKKGILNE